MSQQPSSAHGNTNRPPPRLRQADRSQLLLPMPLDDLLADDHQARVVWDFCLGLDLSTLYDAIRSRQGGPGRAALDPRLARAPFAPPPAPARAGPDEPPSTRGWPSPSGSTLPSKASAPRADSTTSAPT